MGFPSLASTMPLAKKYRRMARNKFLRIIRFRALLTEANIRARFFCRDCGAEVSLMLGDGVIEVTGTATAAIKPKSDRYTLSCRCTVWSVGK